MKLLEHRTQVMRRILEANARRRESLKLHPKLAFLFFELTTRCNLECLHCGSSCTKLGNDRNTYYSSNQTYIDELDAKQTATDLKRKAKSSHINNTDMPPKYIDVVLDSIERNCSKISSFPLLCITGGEPLLYPHLTDVMSMAARRGFEWGMTTNATLINDKIARSLYDAGLVTVTVSIDGLEDSHDWFRNSSGAFKSMERGLKALVKHAPNTARVDVITVVNKRNISELPKIYLYLENSGIRSWRITNMEPIGRALKNTDLMLDNEDFIQLLEFVKNLHLSSPFIEVDFGCSHYLTLKYERLARSYCFTCAAGLQVSSITTNGDIIACLDIERRPDLVQGNVLYDDFWSVWQNKFRLFRGDRTKKSSVCSNCLDKRYCAGDSAHTWDYDYNRPTLCVKQMLEVK